MLFILLLSLASSTGETMQPEIPVFLYYSFLILSVLVFILFAREVRKKYPERKSYVYGLSLWFLVQYLAGKLGFFAIGLGEIPPKIIFIVIPNFIFIFYLWMSERGKEFAAPFEIAFLTSLQSFRIAVELILWQLAQHQLLPRVMSFEGRNYDVLIGLTAPIVGYLYAKGKLSDQLMIIWNIAGVLLVTNVVVHGILSVPGIEVIQTNIPNFIVSFAPFNLLPGVLVPIAYILHVLSLRKLFTK